MDRTVFISGVTGTLGSALAGFFHNAGFFVGGVFEKNDEAAARLGTRCKNSFFKRCRVEDADSVARFFEKLVSVSGGVDVVVNAAGIVRDSVLAVKSPAHWRKVIDVNLTGAFNCAYGATQYLKKSPVGHIVNIGSYRGFGGAAGQGDYAASKAALWGLTKGLARDLGKDDIKVNLVLPGIMDSGMTLGVGLDFSAHCLERPNTLDEICGFIVYLTGMGNVSGQVFNLDSRIIESF